MIERCLLSIVARFPVVSELVVAAVEVPIVEVHISNVHRREAFRHHSYVSPIAAGVIAGFGIRGYEFAVRRLVDLVG